MCRAPLKDAFVSSCSIQWVVAVCPAELCPSLEGHFSTLGGEDTPSPKELSV